MRGVHLGLNLDSDLLQNRHQLIAELLKPFGLSQLDLRAGQPT